MKRLLLAAFCALLVSSPAVADEELYTAQYSACMDKSDGTTFSIMDCISEELAIQDTRLNTAYKKLRAELSDERKTQLRDVQRIWIRYRDANCDFYYDPNGGSLAKISAYHCTLEETALRAKELEQFFPND